MRTSPTLRAFLLIAVIAGLLFAFLTPPFQVPDEVGHFWRASAIVDGQIIPGGRSGGSFARVPEGTRTLVHVFYREMAGKPEIKISPEQFRTAWFLPLRANEMVSVRLPASYTPVPYAPQLIAAGAGRLLGLRPVITFYLGRVLNLCAFLGLVAMAIRITPRLKTFFAAAALLPMALFLGGSWSADAMTTGSAFLLLALLLRGLSSNGHTLATSAAGLAVGLCKPAYFLIALLAFPLAPRKRGAATLVLVATLVGVALSMANAARAYDPGAAEGVSASRQLSGIIGDPLRFAGVLAFEMREHGFRYVEQMVGRLGVMEVAQPLWLIWAEIVVLVLASGAAGGRMSPSVRILSGAVFIVTAGGLFLASYLTWTTVGASHVEGIQGRYFLPVLPLGAVAAGGSLPLLERTAPRLVLAAAVVCNTAAVISVALRFY